MTRRSRISDFDIVIIGSGSGGGVAAHLAAGIGKKVALVEKSSLGGESLHNADIPSKALLESAKIYNIMKSAPDYGMRATSMTFNFRSVQAWKDKAVRHSGVDDSTKAFNSEGITVFNGRAHFIDSHTISMGDKRLTAKNFIIATGARVILPNIPGLKEAGFITFKEASRLEKPPRSLFIIGGGAVACEFAEIFSTFGGRIHIADISKRLLPAEEPETSALLEKLFSEKGVHLHLGSQIIEVNGGAGRKTVTFKTGHETKSVTVEEILLATGKAPTTDLGLENAGVRYSYRGIQTNALLQTSRKHIYAVGDVTGIDAHTHVANHQAKVAINNIFSKKKFKADYRVVPHVTFTDPEIASVGMTEAELKARKILYQVGYAPIEIVGRAMTSGHGEGFVKVLASHTGILLGGTIVGLRAGEMIHELTLAIHTDIKANTIAMMVHAFPTWSEAIRVACSKIICQ